jgi:hypothetical protein
MRTKFIIAVLLWASALPSLAQFKAGADSIYYFPQFVTGPLSSGNSWLVLNQGGTNGYNLNGTNALRLLNGITPAAYQYVAVPQLITTSNDIVALIPSGTGQAGSQNLTNWSQLPTNILNRYAVSTNFVWATNTFWQQVANYASTYAFPTNGNFTNDVTALSVTSVGGIYSIASTYTLYLDFLEVDFYGHEYEAFVVYEYAGNNTTNNLRTNWLARTDFGGDQPHSPDPMDDYTQSGSPDNVNTPTEVRINPKAGTTFNIYTRHEASALGLTPILATNYLDIVVSKPTTIRYLTEVSP